MSTKRPVILVVDDNEPILKLFEVSLSLEGFEVVAASDGKAALKLVQRREPELVILDVMMPGKSGDEVLPEIKKLSPDTQIIMATASTDMHTAIHCMKSGAYDYITKPFDLDQVVLIIRHALRERELVIENRNYKQSLEARVRYQARKLNVAYLNSIKALAQALEAKDRYTKGHSLRVSRLAVAIAGEMGLPQDRIEKLKLAGLVHDIGKIGVSEAVLNKPAALTPGEFGQVKKHPEVGAKILKPLGGDDEIIDAVRGHHERCDGSGYPDGLEAGDIPLGARILAVADCYDAMTSERPYRPPVSATVASREIERLRNTKFDAVVVEAFCKVLRKSVDLLCGSASI